VTLDERWTLDRDTTFLNHGSFGACPRAVLEEQARLRSVIERDPVRFFTREIGPLWEAARDAASAFVGADPDGLVFVPNATTGVNTVLRSASLSAGDEILVSNHGYSACRNAVEAVAAATGAVVRSAEIPFPLGSRDEVIEPLLALATPRTRLAIVDHVTSPTGLVFPVHEIVRALRERGIDVLVDGAHAPGMIDLDLSRLGATYFTGNCHKWLCTPKGAAILWVAEERRASSRPLVISHGAAAPGGQRFHREFDWTGTDDPTAVLCIPKAIEVMASFAAGGWSEVRARNHDLVVRARRLLLDRLGIGAPCPEDMLGSLAAIPLSDATDPPGPHGMDPLHARLYDEHRIQVPVYAWPEHRKRLLRISAQLYNRIEDYERLAGVLTRAGTA
jgi:isopenicillin-N epimerase